MDWVISVGSKEMFSRASVISAVLFIVGMAGWLASWAILDKPPWGIFISLLALFTGMTQAPFVIAILLRTASAQWGARLYRLTAITALSFMPFAAIMLLIVLVARGSIIPWAAHSTDHFWYNPLFFVGRQIIYFGLFYGLTYMLFRTSHLKGSQGARIGNHRLMIGGLFTAVTFVLGATIFSWDLGMTLNHHYGDTIYGTYYIMTSFFAGTALVILMMTFLNRPKGENFFTPLHYRNIASLALALTIMCFYGWWSQFFPIWYANIPEETDAIYLRIFSRFGPAYGLMMVLVSVVPFISLLFKRVRETMRGLSLVAVSVLTGLWIQQYIYSAVPLIENELAADLAVLSPPNILLTLGIAGGFFFVFLRMLQRYPEAYQVLPESNENGDEAEMKADYLFTQPEGW